MNLRTITALIIGITILGLAGYDGYVYFAGDGATISEWFWKHSKEWPIIPFCGGVLIGHLFWNSKS